jgi:hypothetical protein
MPKTCKALAENFSCVWRAPPYPLEFLLDKGQGVLKSKNACFLTKGRHFTFLWHDTQWVLLENIHVA